MTNLRQTLPRRSLETVCQVQQLGLEMVDTEASVVIVAVIGLLIMLCPLSKRADRGSPVLRTSRESCEEFCGSTSVLEGGTRFDLFGITFIPNQSPNPWHFPPIDNVQLENPADRN